MASPLIIQQIIDKVIAQQNFDTLYVLGALLLAVAAFQGILSAVRTYLFADTTNRIDIALGGEVIQHLLRLPLRCFDSVLLVSSPPGLPNWALFVHSLLVQLSPCYLIQYFRLSISL